MSEKIILQNVNSLQNQTSAQTVINSNFQAIAEKLDTFVSRDGDTPNQLEADLDLNSKRIVNLPKAQNPTEPLRKQEFDEVLGQLRDSTFPDNFITSDKLSDGAVEEKLGYVNPLNFSAVGDNTADDTTPINNSLASAGLDKTLYLNPSKSFKVTTFYNPKGVKIIGGGKILSNASQGGQIQLNSYTDLGKVVIGKEYLYRVWKRFEVGGTLSAFIYGDSTVATAANGGGYAGTLYEPQNLLKTYLSKVKGVRTNLSFTNRAVGGTSIYQMNAMADLDILTGSTDLFIIKYGINDSGRGADQFAIDLRTKLAEIRANPFGVVNNLTIILMMPNATYDPAHGRASPWYEQLRGIYEQAARDYKCVLFDTYAFLRDVDWASTHMMDNPFANGQGVHPTSIMQNMIWAGLVDSLFTESELAMYFSDAFVPCTFLNGWVNYNNGYPPVSVSVSRDGWVTLRGMCKNGTVTNGTAIAQFPTGYTPLYAEHFSCPTQLGHTTIRVNVNNLIEIADNNASATYTSLSGIRYRIRD